MLLFAALRPRNLRLERLLQSVDLVVLATQTFHDALVHRLLHGGRAAQNPEVVPAWMPYYRILVVLAEVDDPIVAPEGPKEGDLELGVAGGGSDRADTPRADRAPLGLRRP